MGYVAHGLGVAGQELVKQAGLPSPGQVWQAFRGVDVPLLGRVGGVKAPVRGMALGGIAGAAHGVNDVLQLGIKTPAELAKIRALAAQARTTPGMLSNEMSTAKRQQAMLEQMESRGLRDPGTGKLAPLSGANWQQWLQAVGPHVARRAASWAGAGGMADLGVQTARNLKRNAILEKGVQYGAPVAAGLGAYSLLKD